MRIVIILLLALLFVNIFFKCGQSENFDSVVNQENILSETKLKKRGIPKIIIQTWKDKDIPEKYHKDIETVKNFNPDYTYIYFTDEDIENFLKNNYPEWYETYQKLPVKIQKIDFFRYIAIYHYGGFYFDLDITCNKCLDPLLESSCVFPIDQHIKNFNNSRFKEFSNKNISYLLGQYAFGAESFHPFIKKIIDTIHLNIDKYIIDIMDPEINFNVYVYKSTGPDFVTSVYLDYPNKHNIDILYHKDDQHFGDYAKHNFYGTWK